MTKKAVALSPSAVTLSTVFVKDPFLPEVVLNNQVKVTAADRVEDKSLAAELGFILQAIAKELIKCQKLQAAQPASIIEPETRTPASAAAQAAIEIARRKGASLLNPRVKKQAVASKNNALFDDEEEE